MTGRIRFSLALMVWLTTAGLPYAQEVQAPAPDPGARHAIEFSPVSPFIRIYAAQFARRITDHDELLPGGSLLGWRY